MPIKVGERIRGSLSAVTGSFRVEGRVGAGCASAILQTDHFWLLAAGGIFGGLGLHPLLRPTMSLVSSKLLGWTV